MVICQQYSGSLERRKGFWEAFHHWLETRDFLVSEFKTEREREKKTSVRTCTCARVQSQRYIMLFLYSVISAKRGGEEKKKTLGHVHLFWQ